MTRTLPQKLNQLITSGLGAGFSPSAPGTIGSLVCLGLFFLANHFGLLLTLPSVVWAAVFVFALGTIAVHFELAHNPGNSDPQSIVIDEWLGMLIALTPASLDRPWTLLAAFILFRLFDIYKPGPVGAAEKLPGAFGVMLDDLVAGLLAAIVLACCMIVLPGGFR